MEELLDPNTCGRADCWFPSLIMDINLLLESQSSDFPASGKNSVSAISNSSSATRAYTMTPPAQQSLASEAYVTESPCYSPPSSYPAQALTSSGPMLGGPVLPAISKLYGHPDSASHRPVYEDHPRHPGTHRTAPRTNGSPPQALKRQASPTPLPEESPAKKQFKWTPEEDNLTIELRGQGMKWNVIA